MKDISKQYLRRINKYNSLIKKQNQTINFYSALRLIVFLAGALSSIYFYYINKYIFCSIALFIFLVIFVIFISKHRDIKKNRDFILVLIEINSISLKRFQGEWRKFEDSGQDFKDDSHRYSGDLDVFGEGSLFQWINTSATFAGRIKLKELLTEMPSCIDEIILRQQAVKELSGKIKWRQHLNAEGIIGLKSNKSLDNEALYSWINKGTDFTLSKGMTFISKILPFITIILILISFSTSFVSRNIPYILLILQMGILFLYNKRINSILKTAYYNKKNIISYDKMLRYIEGQNFKSTHLSKIKGKLKGADGETASRKINKLVKIVNLISDRNNMVYIIFNILFLWDIRCVISLEKWKKESGALLKDWVDTIGEFEALSSLSLIHFDNPSWTFPEVENEFPVLSGKAVGHPLIKEKAVFNDIEINNKSSVLLITGSNMSGKSTYLRTAGINLILAYSGAPVNAKAFSCSVMKVFTCMRISDNLEKNISSFYAEILRIKEIVIASKSDKNIFFLLDEIFKGTNSIDRHLGAKTLINKLISEKASGIVSTHDLELGELQGETNYKVSNFHFKEYYENGELHFDYKLRRGISNTRNAMYLIKMAGID